MKRPRIKHTPKLQDMLVNWEPLSEDPESPEYPLYIKKRGKTRIERFKAWIGGWRIVYE